MTESIMGIPVSQSHCYLRVNSTYVHTYPYWWNNVHIRSLELLMHVDHDVALVKGVFE